MGFSVVMVGAVSFGALLVNERYGWMLCWLETDWSVDGGWVRSFLGAVRVFGMVIKGELERRTDAQLRDVRERGEWLERKVGLYIRARKEGKGWSEDEVRTLFGRMAEFEVGQGQVTGVYVLDRSLVTGLGFRRYAEIWCRERGSLGVELLMEIGKLLEW